MKKFIFGFFFLVLFLVIGAAVFILTFDLNRYKTRIEKKVFEATGYALVINGQIKATRALESIINVEDVEIKAAQGFKKPSLLTAKRMQIRLNLKSLLKDEIVVHSVELLDVDVNLEVNKQGAVNWAPAIKKSPQTGARPALKKKTSKEDKGKPVAIADLNMKNVKVSYENEQTADSWKVSFPQLSAQQLLNVSGSVLFKNEKFTFSGTIRNLWATIKKQKNLNFSFDFSSDLLKGKMSGLCRDLNACRNDSTLNVDFSGSDLNKAYLLLTGNKGNMPNKPFVGESRIRFAEKTVLAEGTLDVAKKAVNLTYNVEHDFSTKTGKGRVELDMTDAALTRPMGLEPFSVKANYEVTNGEVFDFSNVAAMFNETDVDGSVRIVAMHGQKPRIDAVLHSHYLKFANIFYMNNNSKADRVSDSKVFSSQKIDWSVLNKMDGQVSVSVDNLSVSNLLSRYPQVSMTARLKDGVLTTNLGEGSVFAGGEVVGQAIVRTGSDNQADLAVSMVAQGLEFDQVVPWKKVLHSGNVSANVDLKAKGQSVADLMANLNGSVLLAVNQVDITSPVVGKLLPEDSSSSTSRASQELFIKCAVVNVSVQDGVIEMTKNVAFETSKFNMVISGMVNLAKETLSLQLIPYRNKVDSKVALSNQDQSVVFEGSFVDPRSRVATHQTPAAESKKIVMTEKQAFLDSYTKKAPVDDNAASVCRIAMGTSVLKDINAYFGRDKQVVQEEKPVEPQQEEKASKAQEIGRDLLGSLSDVLSSK